MPSYRLKCINPKCGKEEMKYWTTERLDYYKGRNAGRLKCSSCGFSGVDIMQSRRMVHDGFQPGWQPNIQRNASSRKEYERYLKELGLVEMGHAYVEEDVKALNRPVLLNADFVKEIGKEGITLPTALEDAIIKGKL